MPGPNTPYTKLDYHQVIRQCFDEAQDRLRVDSQVSFSADELEVVISHTDDSVKIGDGTDFLAVNADGSINVKATLQPGSVVSISKHTNSFYHTDEIDLNDVNLTTSGYTEIFSYTSGSNLLKLIALKIKGDTFGVYRLKVNNITKDYVHTSPIQRNCLFKFYENMPLVSGEEITIEFRPERILLTDYNFFMRIEGYLE